jgi:rhomboid protease GluP
VFGNEGPDAAGQEALAADRVVFARRLFNATPKAWVTRMLVAANVVVFLAMLADGAGLFEANSAVHLRWGANFGPITKEGEWWRLLASTFLHFGLVHLAMNMWALWGAGGLVERLYGNLWFLTVYAFAGLTGSFASLYWNADKVVSAGASGAIFGVYGALAAYVLREPDSVPKAVLKSLTASSVSFIGYSIVIGVMVPTIDNAAHAGGLAGGFALAWFLARPLEPFEPVRAGRVASALAVAGLSVAALFTLLPPARYSYATQKAATEAIQAFADEEDALASKAQMLVDDRRAGRITDRQLGEAIELQILPGWRAAHARFGAIKVEPGAPSAARLAELTEFVRVRRDMFAAYAEGLKSGDAARMRRAEELSSEAQAMMKAMRGRGQ